MESTPTKDRFVRVGQIAGAFGLKGQVKVQPLTDFGAERFRKGARLRLDGDWVEIQSASLHKGRPLLKLSGIDSIDAAEAKQFHFLEAVDRPQMAKNEFLVSDLLGLEVRTTMGERIGTVDSVLQNPAHEILVVDDVMIPFVEQFVKGIDWRTRVVTVELIYGMRPGEL